ncbi:hypothetical protein [Tetragenococcus halophilus]|nr:hypothetical protein [Tetragenococcus halophilus]GMG67485.1 hypothetical protein TEHMS4_04190 [Tetragenococcus halophilus]
MENEKAELMQQVAKDVINGDKVSYPSPEKVKKKKLCKEKSLDSKKKTLF